MGLEEYERKRDLTKTPEPGAANRQTGPVLRFVVQKHAASRLHYDLRLELDGVLKSWAVPKGPTLDPSIKRLAMMVEDHPFDYRTFEGTIPKGNYGAGQVIVWDEGTYQAPHAADPAENERLLRAGLAKGDLKFVLEGHKLHGEFALVRIKGYKKDNSWLLIKKKDQWASTDDVLQDSRSVLSDLRLGDQRGAEALRLQDVPPAAPESPFEHPGGAQESAPRVTPPDRSAAEQGTVSPMPHDVKPMLATLIEAPFDDPGWLFEIKQDGYRAIAELDHGSVQLYSRNNLSFNRRFPSIVDSLKSLPGQAVLDGELVALDEQGRSYFQLLQNNLRSGQGQDNITYFVFDLLYLDGRDLRNLPLSVRKELLRNYLPERQDVRFSDHIEEFGKDFFELAQGNNLEGIVAKRAESVYQGGRRSRDWLKIKIRLEQEAVICGFTAPRGGRKLFGSLVLGAYRDGELVHIGFSGGGFDERMLKELHARLEPLIQPASPFKANVKSDMPVTWVAPSLVCEVSFTEWTDEKVMRQPTFLGLREDKEPSAVHLELPERAVPGALPVLPQTPTKTAETGTRSKELEVLIDGHRIKLSNLDKVFWPEEGYRKGDVIDYYRTMAPVLLPHLKDRPESLYRTPNGITEKGFFQKEAGVLPPDWMLTREIFSESNQKNIRFFICQDEATLVYLANLGCIEINPWLSRLQHLENPDYFVIDLDPEDIAFEKVVDAALEVRKVLEQAQAVSFPKTSGATGIHIYVPLGARYDYDAAVKFAQVVATLVQRQVPDFTSIVRDPRKRQQRVYLDFLQNRGGQTLAAPYSIRPRPGATVSTPLAWHEVRHGLSPQQFTIRTVPERVARLGDLFQGVLGPGIDLERCLENLLSPYR
jgi:bifunctional non-homologous end joining protein LigD